MLIRRGLPLLLVGFLALAVLAQDKDKPKDKPDDKPGDKVKLEWKFEKGKTFYQKMDTTTKQKMKVMGMEVNQTQEQTFVFSWTPESYDEKERTWIIKQKIEGVKMKIEIGGNTINYDSANPGGTANPLNDFFKALVGSEFKLTIGPDMRVLKVEGRDEFLKKLVAANQQMEPLLKKILSDDALKQMADPTFAVVPDKEAKTWKRESKLNMGPIGTYENTYEYTYEGRDSKKTDLDKVSVKTNLKYIPPPSDASPDGLPFQIKSADLKSKDASGFFLFDNKKGRIDRSEMKLTLTGKLTILITGTTTEVDLDQTQETKLETYDKNPLETKPPG